MTEELNTQLDEIVRRLVSEFDPDRIILFGSHAWGQPDEQSDLDLFIIVPESDEIPTRRATRAYRCLRGIGVSLDLLVRTREEAARYGGVRSSLEADILERGKVLYGRDENGRNEAGAGPWLAHEGIA